MIRRVIPHINAVVPSDVSIRDAATSAGLKRYSPSFVRDLAVYLDGGWFNPDVMDEVENEVRSDLVPRRKLYEMKLQDFMSSLASPRGKNGLQQAVDLLVVMSKQKGVSDQGNEDGLPIFLNETPQEASEKSNNFFEALEDLEADTIMSELMGSENEALPVEAVELYQMAQKLRGASGFRVKESLIRAPHPEGNDIVRRKLNGYSEIGRASKRLWAMPNAERNRQIAQIGRAHV